jgi:hypothetical protein
MASCFLVYALSANGENIYPVVLHNVYDIKTGLYNCLDIDYLLIEKKNSKIYLCYGPNVHFEQFVFSSLPKEQEKTINWTACRLLCDRYQLDNTEDCDVNSLPQGYAVFLKTDKQNKPQNYALEEFEQDWRHTFFNLPQLYLKFSSKKEILRFLWKNYKPLFYNAYQRRKVSNLILGQRFSRRKAFYTHFLEFPKYQGK